jgi:hypothetical protein
MMMRDGSKILTGILFFTAISIHNAKAAELCGGFSDVNSTIIDVMGGEYRITNNVWRGTSTQCLSINPDSTFFSVIRSTHDSNIVVAYPSIIRGQHFGSINTKNSGMPIKITDINSIPVEWSADVNHAKGVWNTAFEAWFSPTGGTVPEGGAELMVWLNKKGSIIMPAGGEKKDTITVAGTQWNVYYDDKQRNWKYIAYERAKPAVVTNFDLNDFIKDAVSRGYLKPDCYLDSMEAGFEIIQDGLGLTNRSFSATITKK